MNSNITLWLTEWHYYIDLWSACLVAKGIDENCFGCMFQRWYKLEAAFTFVPWFSSAGYFIRILFPWLAHVLSDYFTGNISESWYLYIQKVLSHNFSSSLSLGTRLIWLICTYNVSELNLLFPFFPATALTPDNVLSELKELNWKTLCNTNTDVFLRVCDGVLELPVSEGQRIERMYASEEERKRAGVSWWVDHHPLASYRLLITRLDWEGKHSHPLANRIHQYAEKVTGMLSSILYYHWQLYNSS